MICDVCQRDVDYVEESFWLRRMDGHDHRRSIMFRMGGEGPTRSARAGGAGFAPAGTSNRSFQI
jgi:hypothetical protein